MNLSARPFCLGLGDLRGKMNLAAARRDCLAKRLPKAIRAADGIAHEIIVYHTLLADADAKGLPALKSGVDWVTFTSPSTVQNFAHICRQNGLNPLDLPGKPKIACIGPITEKAARKEGFTADVTAEEYTTDGLIEVICKWRPDVERV
jgi:uroporphyrinogen-III synthase